MGDRAYATLTIYTTDPTPEQIDVIRGILDEMDLELCEPGTAYVAGESYEAADIPLGFVEDTCSALRAHRIAFHASQDSCYEFPAVSRTYLPGLGDYYEPIAGALDLQTIDRLILLAESKSPGFDLLVALKAETGLDIRRELERLSKLPNVRIPTIEEDE